MISRSRMFDLKFALVDFQCNKNNFTENFAGLLSNGKDFSKKYRELSRTAFLATPIESASTVVTIDEAGNGSKDTTHKTPIKKAGKKAAKRKTTPTPEGAELPSPEKLLKPNSIDEDIQAHYLGMLYVPNMSTFVVTVEIWPTLVIIVLIPIAQVLKYLRQVK